MKHTRHRQVHSGVEDYRKSLWSCPLWSPALYLGKSHQSMCGLLLLCRQSRPIVPCLDVWDWTGSARRCGTFSEPIGVEWWWSLSKIGRAIVGEELLIAMATIQIWRKKQKESIREHQIKRQALHFQSSHRNQFIRNQTTTVQKTPFPWPWNSLLKYLYFLWCVPMKTQRFVLMRSWCQLAVLASIN